MKRNEDRIARLLAIEQEIRALPDAEYEEIKAAQSAAQSAVSLGVADAKREQATEK